MSWLDHVQRDPVPWLLDPANPSARFLTLRDIFRRPEPILVREHEALLSWEPIRTVIKQANPVSFWGRVQNPYFGGAVGTFGTLYMLTQLGIPAFPLAEKACENLLRDGRLRDGRFAPERGGPMTWLCYTGMALQILWHFGFGEEPRTQTAGQLLVEAINHHPEFSDTKSVGSATPAEMVKILHGLLSIPLSRRSPEDKTAVEVLTQRLLTYGFNFAGRDADWLQLHFPRYYETDLLETCHALVHSAQHQHPRFREFLRRVVQMQTDEGRWRKIRAAPGTFQVERMGRPSRWLTFEAVHILIMVYGGNVYAP